MTAIATQNSAQPPIANLRNVPSETLSTQAGQGLLCMAPRSSIIAISVSPRFGSTCRIAHQL